VIEIEGKQVLTSLDELVAPRHVALLLIDLQKDFLDPDGAFGRMGIDQTMYPPMRATTATLLAAARAAGVLVVHVQMSALPGRLSDSPAQIRFNTRLHARRRAGGPPLRYTEVGSHGHQFIDEAQPLPAEPVVQKWRSSGFWGTNLDMVLRSNGVESVLVAGCTTEGCVESTARDAMFNDYYVVIVEDCVASDDREQHEASLLLMRHRFDIACAADISGCWAGASAL